MTRAQILQKYKLTMIQRPEYLHEELDESEASEYERFCKQMLSDFKQMQNTPNCKTCEYRGLKFTDGLGYPACFKECPHGMSLVGETQGPNGCPSWCPIQGGQGR